VRRVIVSITIAVVLAVPLVACRFWFDDLGAYPQNDDPYYGRPTKIWIEENRVERISQYGLLSASGFAHFAWGTLVGKVTGYSYQNLHLSVAIMAWFGALALYGIGRELGGSRWLSLMLGMMLMLNPFYFGHAFTFMTDTTATALLCLASYCFIRGFRLESHRWWLAGSLAVGLAILTRQTHLALMAFPWLVWLSRARSWPSWKQAAGELAAISGPAIAVLFLLESGLLIHDTSGRLDTVLNFHFTAERIHEMAVESYGVFLLLGLTLLPAAPLLASQLKRSHQQLGPRARRWALGTAVITGGLLLTAFLVTAGRAHISSATGYFLQNAHFGPVFLSDLDYSNVGRMGGVTWPVICWQILTLLSIANASQLAWWVIYLLNLPSLETTRSSYDKTIAWCGLGLISMIAAVLLIFLGLFYAIMDRYWMILFASLFSVLAILLTRPSVRIPRWAWTTAVTMTLIGGTISVIFTHDFLLWNQTRWTQIEFWIEAGLKAEEFDGGRDVNAWFRSAEDPQTMRRPGDTSPWWSGRAHLSLSIDPRSGWHEIDRLHWRAWATGRQHKILVLKLDSQESP